MVENNKNTPGKIEKSVLSQNKIPGCDQLTRPEEIKALSKYLGNIKKVQEKHTTLQKDNLEVPGRTTGRIPKVEIPDFVDPLVTSKNREKAVPYKESSRVPLEKNHDPAELNKAVVGLEDDRKTKLDNRVYGLKDDRDPKLVKGKVPLKKTPDDPELEKGRVGLEDDREIGLGKTRVGLKDTRETALGNHREGLVDDREPSLEEYRENLRNIESLESLGGYKESLTDSRETTLGNYREGLEKNHEPAELNKAVIGLTDDREITLGKIQEKLKNIESLDSLGETRIPLDGAQGLESYTIVRAPSGESENLSELPDQVEPLKNVKPIEELGNHREELTDDRDTELPGDSEKLDFGEGLEGPEELGNYKDPLSKTPESIEKLGNYRKELIDDRETTLPDNREPLNFGDNLGGVDSVEDYREPLDYGENLEGPEAVEDHVEKLDFGDRLGDDDNFLEDHVEELTDNRQTTLEDYIDPLNYGENLGGPESVEDYREPLDYGDNLGDSDNFVEDHVEPLDFGENLGDSDNFVEDHVEKLNFGDNLEPVNSVEDYIEPLDFGDRLGDDDNFLEDHVEELTDNRETTLEDFIDKLTDDRETELPDHVEELGEHIDGNRSEDSPNYFDRLGEGGELYDEAIERPETDEEAPRAEGIYNYFGLEPNGGGGELYTETIERPGPDPDVKDYIDTSTEGDGELPEYKALERPEASQESPRADGQYNYIDTTKDILGSFSELTGNELYNKAMKFMKDTESGEWEKKVQSLMSSYLSGSTITPEQAEEYEKKLGKEIKVAEELIDLPPMKLPSFNLDSLNISNYLRYTAEKTVGAITSGGLRETLIQETLAGLIWARDELERVSKSDRSRLPGSDMGLVSDLVSGGVSGALDNLGNRLGNAVTSILGKSDSVNMNNPVNYPSEDTTGWTSTGKRISQSQTAFSQYNFAEYDVHKNIVEDNDDGGGSSGFWGKVGSSLKEMAIGGGSNGEVDYLFSNNYLKGSGIKTTLEGLTDSKPSSVESVEDLKVLLSNSSYITTPGKFGSYNDLRNGLGSYRVQTLDSDAYWEIILEPYLGPENGNLSYLPGLHEINLINIAQHGVNTGYNRWIPFQGFDLQKAKMTNKTLQLYDGEISYPISMEYLNEFRLTIADDQYKSWRTYFERCAKVAIYNSEGHNKSFYESASEITAIDTGNVIIAMYKNITFRCQIFIMTPQFSTIHKYDLLLVMKDFAEEHSGSIDGGAGDLSISFSIVGENPENTSILTNSSKYKTNIMLDEKNSSSSSNIVGSIVEKGVNVGVGLIKDLF